MTELKDRALKAGTPYKAKTYETAIHSVESHHDPITSGEEMMAYPGIGPKTATKIQEIIDTVIPFLALISGDFETVKR